MPVNGVALGYAVAGGIVLYSGIKGGSISDTVKTALTGSLSGVTDSEQIITTADVPSAGGTSAPGDTGAANAGASSNQALARQLATSMGYSSWTTGDNWQDWVSLWNQESGWNIDAANPASSARGIAQNIQGYGPDYEEGNAVSQITWGINYISSRYGSPAMAWAHETEYNWY